MGNVWLSWLADDLEAAGLQVVRYAGWTTRARSSGGYSGTPLCMMWHHTASSTSPENDCYYMCHTSGDRPICNLLVARDGEVWVLAAGATNTNGKGQATHYSRGSVPKDSMNSWAVGMEIANNGVGEQYPQAQIDAAFTASNVINHRLGNQPSDVCTHQHYAPDRKIDPATCNVAGLWQPRSCTSSDSWDVTDLIDECVRRAGADEPSPGPDPSPPPEEDDMPRHFLILDPNDGSTQFVSDMATFKTPVSNAGAAAEGVQMFGWQAFREGTADPYPLGPGWADYVRRLPVTN